MRPSDGHETCSTGPDEPRRARCRARAGSRGIPDERVAERTSSNRALTGRDRRPARRSGDRPGEGGCPTAGASVLVERPRAGVGGVPAGGSHSASCGRRRSTRRVETTNACCVQRLRVHRHELASPPHESPGRATSRPPPPSTGNACSREAHLSPADSLRSRVAPDRHDLTCHRSHSPMLVRLGHPAPRLLPAAGRQLQTASVRRRRFGDRR